MEEKLALVVRWVGKTRNETICCASYGHAQELVDQLNKANTHSLIKYEIEELLDEETAMKDELESLENYKNRQNT